MEIKITEIPQLDEIKLTMDTILAKLTELRSELCLQAKEHCTCTETGEPPKRKGRGRKAKKEEPAAEFSGEVHIAGAPENTAIETNPEPSVEDDPFAELDTPETPVKEITLDDIREAASKKMTTAEMRSTVINKIRRFVPTGKIDQLKAEDYPVVLDMINGI